MNFQYPSLNTVEFRGLRWYETPAGFFPSVTSVLGKTMEVEKVAALERWRNALGASKADAYTRNAADKGTAVHLLIEAFLKGEPLPACPPNILAEFNALKLHLKKISVWGQEVALFSKKLEIAGRCDCIGTYEGQPAIIDFKTSARIKKQKDISDYKLQITAYAEAHNEMFNTDIKLGIVLMSSAGGFPQVFKIITPEYRDALVERVKAFYKNIYSEI